MAQLFTPGAQFPSRKHLYAARNQLHRTTGYKLVVQNCNKEQVIFVCNQANALPPKLKCPVKVRANCGKHTSVWTISPHAKFDHLCNVEDHPLPTKSTKAIAEHLSSRIQHELHSLPTAPGLITSFKTDEGTHPSLKTVYRGIQLGKDSVFGSELESLCKLECYLERLVESNPGSQMVFNLDAEGRFLRALYVAPYAANFL